MFNIRTRKLTVQQEQLRVQTDLNAISEVAQWFEQFRKPPLTDECWLQGQVALIEGFTNAVRHAHANLPLETPVDVSVRICPAQLEIRIWDEGPAFNLNPVIDAVVQQSHPLDREAHWGGVFFQKLRDKHRWTIHYDCPINDPCNLRNCLILKKQL
jgi:serine/threonine-protein kinase RsbW